MKKIFRLLILAAFAAFSPAILCGQVIKFSPKFDSVSADEVKMTSYPLDTSASAVVIYKYLERNVYLAPSGDFYLKRVYRYRFKVLKESAKDIGDFELIYRTDGEMSEKINEIKVITYNWEDGKVVKTKMGKDFIFDKKYSEHAKRISFSAQNVKVGSVIEVYYERLNKHFWDIGDIGLQSSIPYNCVEAKVVYPEWLKYNAISRGLKLYSRNQSFEGKTVVMGHGSTLDYSAVVENYRAQNIPALKAEDNIYCISQFFSQVSYELRSIRIPGQLPKNYASKWEDVDRQFLESPIVSEINAGCKFKSEIDPIKNSDKPFVEKVAAIRNIVASKVKWDENVRLVPRSASTVLKEASGSNADMNALCGSALKYAGFEVVPVVIKLRSNGELEDFHVSIDVFNTFVLKVSSGKGETVLLDAASNNAYVNIFPYMFLIPNARQITKVQGAKPWIDITAFSTNETSYEVAAKIDEDGLITGTMEVRATGEESMYLKKFYTSEQDKEKLYSKLESGNSYTITNIEARNMNEYTPDCSMTIEFESQQQTTEDRIYLKPMLEKMASQSKFKSETRSVPIDFPYRETQRYDIKVELPDGYEVEQIPSNTTAGALSVDSKAATEYKMSPDGKAIEMTFIYTLKDMYVNPRDYSDFRKFWLQLVRMGDETIVLKKK